MADIFEFELVTPVKQLANEKVSEVILPAYDGEVGVLANHENFIGLLGTGPLKIVREGNDFWYMVSSGVYQVKDGKLTVCTELGEKAESVRQEMAQARIAELEGQLSKEDIATSERELLTRELQQHKARVEVYKRTSVVN